MHIEKLNDKQIRCTLNQKDLAERELQISELAYGSAKAKALFRDMMQQASYEYGFETEDIPLMIEAIPLSPDTLILVVTKVDDPDELDSRFSRFAGDEDFDLACGDPDNPFDDEYADTIDGTFSFDNLEEIPYTGETQDTQDFISLSEALGMEPRPATPTEKQSSDDILKLFTFSSLQELNRLATHIADVYQGDNQIYKDPKCDVYYLVAHQSEHNAKDFGQICNIITEYGTAKTNMYATYAFLEEHCELLIKQDALQTLAKI